MIIIVKHSNGDLSLHWRESKILHAQYDTMDTLPTFCDILENMRWAVIVWVWWNELLFINNFYNRSYERCFTMENLLCEYQVQSTSMEKCTTFDWQVLYSIRDGVGGVTSTVCCGGWVGDLKLGDHSILNREYAHLSQWNSVRAALFDNFNNLESSK